MNCILCRKDFFRSSIWCMAFAFAVSVVLMACDSHRRVDCNRQYAAILQEYRYPEAQIDSGRVQRMFYVANLALGCKEIHSGTIRNVSNYLSYHGRPELAYKLLSDPLNTSRRALLDTILMTGLLVRMHDTADAKRLIGKAMVGRVLLNDSGEVYESSGEFRSEILGLVLAKQLDVDVDTSLIAASRKSLPPESVKDFDQTFFDLRRTLMLVAPDKRD
jgi:hypothetical protein